jgi:hypothetical protein
MSPCTSAVESHGTAITATRHAVSNATGNTERAELHRAVIRGLRATGLVHLDLVVFAIDRLFPRVFDGGRGVARPRLGEEEERVLVVGGEGLHALELHQRRAGAFFGDLEVNVQSTPGVSQAGAFAPGGRTVTTTQADVTTKESTTIAALPATTTLAELVAALKLLGATPRELVEILQAIHSAGALDAGASST